MSWVNVSVRAELMSSVWTFPADFRKQQHLQPHCEASDKTQRHCWGNGGVVEGIERRAHSAEASWDDGGKRRINRCRLPSSSSAGSRRSCDYTSSSQKQTGRCCFLPLGALTPFIVSQGESALSAAPPSRRERGGEMFPYKPDLSRTTHTHWARRRGVAQYEL